MSLLVTILIVLFVLGVLLWGLAQLPLDATIKQIIRVVAICVVLIWVVLKLLPFLRHAV